MFSLVHEFMNDMQDLGTSVKNSKMNAVDNQKPFEHLTAPDIGKSSRTDLNSMSDDSSGVGRTPN
jgi:hypothetical protein